MLCYLNNTEDHIVGFSTYFTKATASIRNEQSMVKQLLSIKMYVFYFWISVNSVLQQLLIQMLMSFNQFKCHKINEFGMANIEFSPFQIKVSYEQPHTHK